MLKLNAIYSKATRVKHGRCSERNIKRFPRRAKDEILKAKGNRESQKLPKEKPLRENLKR